MTNDDRIIVVASNRALAMAWGKHKGFSPRQIIHVANREHLQRIRGTRGIPNTWIVPIGDSGAIRDVAAIVECLRILESPYFDKDKD